MRRTRYFASTSAQFKVGFIDHNSLNIYATPRALCLSGCRLVSKKNHQGDQNRVLPQQFRK